MSRHFFECELRCTVRVRLGYDQPVKEFFLQVERVGAEPCRGTRPSCTPRWMTTSTVETTSTTTGRSSRPREAPAKRDGIRRITDGLSVGGGRSRFQVARTLQEIGFGERRVSA